MKKILALIFISTSCFSYSQVLGVKFNNPKTFIVDSAQTVVTDTITIKNIVDDGERVEVTVVYYVSSIPPFRRRTKNLIVWSGQDYINNQNWNKNSLKQRVKDILNQ